MCFSFPLRLTQVLLFSVIMPVLFLIRYMIGQQGHNNTVSDYNNREFQGQHAREKSRQRQALDPGKILPCFFSMRADPEISKRYRGRPIELSFTLAVPVVSQANSRNTVRLTFARGWDPSHKPSWKSAKFAVSFRTYSRPRRVISAIFFCVCPYVGLPSPASHPSVAAFGVSTPKLTASKSIETLSSYYFRGDTSRN